MPTEFIKLFYSAMKKVFFIEKLEKSNIAVLTVHLHSSNHFAILMATYFVKRVKLLIRFH